MSEPPSPEFIRAFKARSDAHGVVRFDTFMDLALYDPDVGYYRRHRQRVGYTPETDFFTASTSGPVFGELVAAAAVKLLGPLDPATYSFVEIGAENADGILEGVSHPFGRVHTIRLGNPLELSGPCVVFSNELFDAQPFRRFRFQKGRWCELGVALRDGLLTEVLIPDITAPAAPLRIGAESVVVEAEANASRYLLPVNAPEGYTLDAPIAAARLGEIIARQSWTGLFIGFDYGKSWRELIEGCPEGTSRAYYRHTQTNDLLSRPGEQDMTCHICWDWMIDALVHHGFASPKVDTQESFFVHNADGYLQKAITEDATRLTRRKQSLLQLLHGSHLGQKFQVLSAIRTQPT